MLYDLGFDFNLYFFFNDTATTEIYTLSLHDALPISEEAMTPLPQIPVELDRTDIPFLPPLGAALALRRLYGADGVFLMEALAGPDPAVRRALVGFGPLLTLEVRDRAVRFAGAPALVAAVEALAAGVLGADGRLDADGGLWRLLRAIRDGFAVVGHPDPGAAYGFGFLGYLGYDTVDRKSVV